MLLACGIGVSGRGKQTGLASEKPCCVVSDPISAYTYSCSDTCLEFLSCSGDTGSGGFRGGGSWGYMELPLG